jgi:hypothetical protein
LGAGFSECRAAWSIDDLELLENAQGALGFVGKDRRRNYRLASNQAISPIWACG